MQVEAIDTWELGDRSYVVHDGEVAVVVDPQRDLDRVEVVLARSGVRVALVCETHRHNDYVTGGYALARATGAVYVVPGGEDVVCDRKPVSDGDVLTAGALTVRVVTTPGHTSGHVAYAVTDGTGAPAAFTGGSLLYGTVGRTDLEDPARAEELCRAQHRSVRRLAILLQDDSPVYPTHGFGSYCSSGAATKDGSGTLGEQRGSNDVFRLDEDAFAEALVARFGPYPAYYARMGATNRLGPDAADLSQLPLVPAQEWCRRARHGEWVVDVRDRAAFASGHVPRTVSVPLGPNLATYLGWLMPEGARLTLVGDSWDGIAEAQRQLVRIGVDRPSGAGLVDPSDATGSTPRVDLAALTRERGAFVLDVRRDDERADGGVTGSTHVPLHELPDRIDSLPDERVWVHCAAGYRAAVAASLLERAGRDAVLVDDSYAAAVAAGITTEGKSHQGDTPHD